MHPTQAKSIIPNDHSVDFTVNIEDYPQVSLSEKFELFKTEDSQPEYDEPFSQSPFASPVYDEPFSQHDPQPWRLSSPSFNPDPPMHPDTPERQSSSPSPDRESYFSLPDMEVNQEASRALSYDPGELCVEEEQEGELDE